MKNYRMTGLISICLMLLVSLAATFLYGTEHHRAAAENSYQAPLPKAPMEEDPLKYIEDDFTVDEGFTSHLPIVILDTNGEEPPVNTYFESNYSDHGLEIYVPIEGWPPI